MDAIEVSELWRPHESMLDVVFPNDTQAYYTVEQCKQVRLVG